MQQTPYPPATGFQPSQSDDSTSKPVRSPSFTTRTRTTTTPSLHPVFVTILGILFLTLIIGHLLSSSTPESRLNARIPSAAIAHLPPAYQPSSFWADKRNFVNRVFVKRAWAWTTGILLTAWFSHFGETVHVYEHNHDHASEHEHRHLHANVNGKRSVMVKGFVRYVVATLGWIFVTQWFAGASLSERVLKWTGAQCVSSLRDDGAKKFVLISEGMPDGKLVSQALCERRWGQQLSGADLWTLATQRPYWSGGFDISGHTFLLTLSLLLILTSVSPLLARRSNSLPRQVAVVAHLGFAGVCWWMLFMTCIFFHGPVEKLLGMLLGMGVWWTSLYTAGL